jgi:HEAT repeat protein/Flp pilus assembly protein TadD
MSKLPLAALFVATLIGSASPAMSAPAWTLPVPVLLQQEDAAKPAADPKAFQELLDRISKLEAEVERLKNGAPGQPKAAPNGGQILTLVESAHLGLVYLPSGQSRFIAIQLIIANTSDKAVNLAQDQITAEIDGEVRKLETLPPEIANQGFQHKNQGYSLQNMQPEKNRTVPAGGQVSFWLVFPKVAVSNSIPKCKVKLGLGDATKEVDINSVQRAVLGLETKRIGPRNCLALLTITGTMTVFNSQALVDEIEQLVSQKIARVVVRWSTDAPQPDGQILNWLQNATANFGQIRNGNEIFPSIPAALREFHLVRFSDKDNTNFAYRGNNMGPPRIHASSADAVGAALRTAFVALPKDELLQEIREGNPLVRAAALAFGGSRLDAEHLPQIFQWTTDADVDVQKAAVQTLSHFGEQEAVEKLVFYVKRNSEPLASAAIESLAGSRFGNAHEALLQLLKNEPPESKKRIVQVLARYPRPVWSETLFEFANDPRDGLNLDAVKALVQVGHAKLVDILEAGLKGTDKPLKDYCFQTLSGRTDERSEKLAIDYTLAHLKDSPPDGNMNQLLARTKDARALPLLLDLLDRGGDRIAVINLLVQMGDQSVAEKLAQKYPLLQSNSEKAQVLTGLRQFRHPKFREFAGAALLSSDSTLVSTAANNLMQEGHPEGEKLLIVALEKQVTPHLLHNITNALANYATPGARAALLKAKDSSDTHKQNYARNALAQIRQRSPGFQYVAQGIQRMQAPVDAADKEAKAQQEKDALEFFELALQLDPQMAEAYAGRGKLHLRQEKLAEAGKDFERAIELNLDPEDHEVVTGLALSRVADGKLDSAIKLIEAGREKHKNAPRGLYLYNTACVYSRSVQYLREHKEIADAAAKIDEYRKKALADLDQSVKQGFPDFSWMARDPDFTTLRDDPDFKKLLASKPADKPDDEKKTEDDE